MPSLRRSFNERWREGPGPVGNIACPAGMVGSMVGKADLPDPPSITSVDKADPAWRCGEAIFYSYRRCFSSHRRYFYFYLFFALYDIVFIHHIKNNGNALFYLKSTFILLSYKIIRKLTTVTIVCLYIYAKLRVFLIIFWRRHITHKKLS